MTRTIAPLTAVVLSASSALAGGFVAPGQSALATGRAGSLGAAKGASAIYYNPAGIVGLPGLARAELGVALLMPSIDAKGTTLSGASWSASTQGGVTTPPPVSFYLQAGLRRIALGLGLYVPFGNSVDWGTSWEGRFKVTSIGLSAVNLQPSLAIEIMDGLSIGAGAAYSMATVRYQSAANFIQSEAAVDIGGAASGWMANLGVRYAMLDDTLALGLSWRSGMDLHFTGNVDFKDVPPTFASRAMDQPVASDVSLPGVYTLAADWKVMPELILTGQVDYTLWSVFEDFGIDFENEATPDVLEARDWRDAATFRLGGEYTLSDALTVRGGYFYDMAVGPAETLSPSSPDMERHGIALGGTLSMGKAAVDAGYMLVVFQSRESAGAKAFPAEYWGMANVLTLSLRYAL